MQAPTLGRLGRLSGLRDLRLEHLVLSDTCCAALASLTDLRHLSLMGAESVSNEGLLALPLNRVIRLNLAWTGVTLLPLLPELEVGHSPSHNKTYPWPLSLSGCSSLPLLRQSS
jgi:hypothetical protein